ncbi:MAG: TRAP transporter substrate-binding protein [Lachnospiraceae bacterium]|nr:TRAP transporter substrate-binding protein [Lachnospiraceae bacterium]
MKKRILSAALCTAMVAGSLAGCGMKTPEAPATTAAPAATEAASEAATEAAKEGETTAAAATVEPEITLVMAEVNPLDTIVGQTDNAFKEKVEELSGGKMVIDLQASGVLGSENDVLDSMLGGGSDIDISRISAFALTSYGAKKSTLLSIPYTFENREHYWKFVDSDLSQQFLDESYDAGIGVKGLFYGEEGFRHFFTKDPVAGVEDFKGKKIRVSTDPVMTGMVSALGANATVVSMNELYSALQTGVVDGAEQPIANYKSNAFPEVANNLILDGHTLGAIEIVITSGSWDALTEEQQNILVEAGKYAGQVNREISQEKEDSVLEELKAAGCNVVDVADKTPWKEACAAVIEENTKDQADLYQQILDLAK